MESLQLDVQFVGFFSEKTPPCTLLLTARGVFGRSPYAVKETHYVPRKWTKLGHVGNGVLTDPWVLTDLKIKVR